MEGFGNHAMRKAAGCRPNLKKEEAGSLRQHQKKKEEAGSKATRQKEEAGGQMRKVAAGRPARGATILGRTSRAAGRRLPSTIVIPIITGPGPGLRAGLWRRARLRCAVEAALLAVMPV